MHPTQQKKMARIELSKDLHQSLFVSVNPNHFYGLSPKREGLEQILYYFASHKLMLVSLMSVSYIFSIIYGYFLLDATRFWINNAVITIQIILHRKNIYNSIKKEEDIVVSIKVEKIRMVISAILMSCRVYALSCNKVLLVPLIFIWNMGTNKMYCVSFLWSITPIIFMSMVFMSICAISAFSEFQQFGLSERFMAVISDGVGLMCTLWFTTYYLITVTGAMHSKLEHVQETRDKLEKALATQVRL